MCFTVSLLLEPFWIRFGEFRFRVVLEVSWNVNLTRTEDGFEMALERTAVKHTTQTKGKSFFIWNLFEKAEFRTPFRSESRYGSGVPVGPYTSAGSFRRELWDIRQWWRFQNGGRWWYRRCRMVKSSKHFYWSGFKPYVYHQLYFGYLLKLSISSYDFSQAHRFSFGTVKTKGHRQIAWAVSRKEDSSRK